jgi:D-amino-acid dehydrogenase
VDADAFVLAAGAECGRLAGLAGKPLPVQAGKGYSITIGGPEVTLAQPLFLDGAKVGFTPFRDAVRILGTMEFSGINRDLDRRRLRILESAARRFVPGLLDAGDRRDWVGMRPVTPDGLPIIGPLPGAENVWVATGHQMLGVTLAPPTGRLVADLVCGRAPAVDPAPFRADRF